MSGWLHKMTRRGKRAQSDLPTAVERPATQPRAPLSRVPKAHDLPMTERLSALRQGAPLPLVAMETVHCTINGRQVAFCVNMLDDPIQNAHRKGQFYERQELETLAQHIPAGATVLDIGANTGNHAMWWAMFGGAARVIVVEPNPLALEPLVGNVLGNQLESIIDLSHLGFGLGEFDSDDWGMKKHDRNLGATKMFAGQGTLSVRRGDTVFAQLSPDVVKIDVEGMEMAVLAGLNALISRARPVIMIEVRDTQADEFAQWASAQGYEIQTLSKELKFTNHLLLPKT